MLVLSQHLRIELEPNLLIGQSHYRIGSGLEDNLKTLFGPYSLFPPCSQVVV